MGRKPCCSKEDGLNRGAWTAMEDKILVDYIKTHSEGKWRSIPKAAGLKRCGKSCRLRWLNYLRPDIKRGNITNDEEDLIIRLHKLLGNRWSLIAGRLPGRTDNEIKNYWNTVLSKRAAQVEGFDRINKDEKKQRFVSWSRKKGAPLTSTSGTAIHAKAERCSKVFITPQQQQQQRIIAKDNDNYNVVRTVPSIDDANLVHESTAAAVPEPEPSDGSFPIWPSESSKEENPSREFIPMDFRDVGEVISISEALLSDFDFCDMNSAVINDQYGTNDCVGQALSSSPEEMVENYWNSNDCFELEANLDSDFGFLEALLESNEDFNNLN